MKRCSFFGFIDVVVYCNLYRITPICLDGWLPSVSPRLNVESTTETDPRILSVNENNTFEIAVWCQLPSRYRKVIGSDDAYDGCSACPCALVKGDLPVSGESV